MAIGVLSDPDWPPLAVPTNRPTIEGSDLGYRRTGMVPSRLRSSHDLGTSIGGCQPADMAHAKSSSKSISQQPCRAHVANRTIRVDKGRICTSPHTLSLIAPISVRVKAGGVGPG